MRAGRLATLAVALALLAPPGCRRGGGPGGAGTADPLAEARLLVEQGRYDEAISSLGTDAGADAQLLLGRAWMGKARSAPLPTPVPGAPPGGAPMKLEEARALECFERAVAERPDLAEAHLATADLLAPYALARTAARDPRAEADVGRVLRAYGDAAQADPAGAAALEGLIRFAVSAGRLTEADGAFQELIRRRREDPALLVRYGDFLAGTRHDPEAALSPYGQALIWQPDDEATRVKVAAIHLDAAAALLSRHEYAAAEARLREARRQRLDPASAQGGRLAQLDARLREIRGR